MIRSLGMAGFGSVLVSLLLIGVILFFAAREMAHYRKDQVTHAEINPDSKARLVRRWIVSICMIVEVVLLALLRFTLSPAHPIWFLVYVLMVLFFAMVMVVLALLDLILAFKMQYKRFQ